LCGLEKVEVLSVGHTGKEVFGMNSTFEIPSMKGSLYGNHRTDVITQERERRHEIAGEFQTNAQLRPDIDFIPLPLLSVKKQNKFHCESKVE